MPVYVIWFRRILLALAAFLEAIALLGMTGKIGVAQPEAWQAGALLAFILSFLIPLS